MSKFMHSLEHKTKQKLKGKGLFASLTFTWLLKPFLLLILMHESSLSAIETAIRFHFLYQRLAARKMARACELKMLSRLGSLFICYLVAIFNKRKKMSFCHKTLSCNKDQEHHFLNCS